MLELFALRDLIGRQVRMVVEANVVAVEHARQLFARERLPVDVDRRVVGAIDLPPHRRELIVAVDEQGFHVPPARPAAARVAHAAFSAFSLRLQRPSLTPLASARY